MSEFVAIWSLSSERRTYMFFCDRRQNLEITPKVGTELRNDNEMKFDQLKHALLLLIS